MNSKRPFLAADAEIVFQQLIERTKSDGTFQMILDDYLQKKIKREREKYAISDMSQHRP